MPPASSLRDVDALPERYRRFWRRAGALLPTGRMFCDPLRTLAYGTDASFYRLVPKIVLRVQDTNEVCAVLGLASELRIPVTFRAAGTSLCGQAITDSVLIQLSGWKRAQVMEGGALVTLEPGVIGAEANTWLAPYERKIGPDPASIASCMLGGIVANNASGMCCGTAQNSYHTVKAMKVVLADGSTLDTGDPRSRRGLRETRGTLLGGLRETRGTLLGTLLAGLLALRARVLADASLTQRIRDKYRIKNTTGYSLNALVDFQDPVDILTHLLVGSEGTLGFVAEVTLATVPDYPHKASALVLFADVGQAARAAEWLKNTAVTAAELMDRASLRSVESKPGLPSVLSTLPRDACALLVEVRAPDASTLMRDVHKTSQALSEMPLLEPPRFVTAKEEVERLWDVRRGLFPAVGAARRPGTTVVIEDVVFPPGALAQGTVDLRRLLDAHGYTEAIIFGHALDGNLHFVFTPDFGDLSELIRYRDFMTAVSELVVGTYDGSLKGEHGTGRNMAPFVEQEWGAVAYGIMREIKTLFDPRGVLNPGVLLSDNPRAHLEHLKPLAPALAPAQAHEDIDRCIECGFCEPVCPSRTLTLTPRQRIVILRELASLESTEATLADEARAERIAADFEYLGKETCATDGLCALACPVGIDTGRMIKHLRAHNRSAEANDTARRIGKHFALATRGARASLAAASAAHAVLGTQPMQKLTRGLRSLSRDRLPLWTPSLPRPAPDGPFVDVVRGLGRRVVYLPACTVRTMGPARGDPDERALFVAMQSLLGKAGWDVLYPHGIRDLCCGLTFDSKGFPDLARAKANEVNEALLERSEGGALPVLCDTSPCVQRLREVLDPRLSIYEPVEFIHDYLREYLSFSRCDETIAIHLTCSAAKMGLASRLQTLARACATRVVMPPTGCCGFAGDKGLTTPELNAAALAGLAAALPEGCHRGYSNSRTCEIGLSHHAGVPYQSIVYLVDRCTSPR